MRDEFDIGKAEVQDYPCDNCNKLIKDATVPRCCDGNGYGWGGCGCMGRPTSWVTCSDKCEKIIMSKYRQYAKEFVPKRKPYTKVYRGILIEVRTGYANPRLKSMQVCVHTPDIERYFKSTAGVRRFIDKFLSSYYPVDNGIPF